MARITPEEKKEEKLAHVRSIMRATITVLSDSSTLKGSGLGFRLQFKPGSGYYAQLSKISPPCSWSRPEEEYYYDSVSGGLELRFVASQLYLDRIPNNMFPPGTETIEESIFFSNIDESDLEIAYLTLEKIGIARGKANYKLTYTWTADLTVTTQLQADSEEEAIRITNESSFGTYIYAPAGNRKTLVSCTK